MDLYKIIETTDRVYVLTLVYNPKVWCGHQWSYMYVTDYYPSEKENQAKNFGLIENAWKWIQEHTPKL